MGLECAMQEDLGPPDCIMAQEETLEDLEKEGQIWPKEKLEEVNLGANQGPSKPFLSVVS